MKKTLSIMAIVLMAQLANAQIIKTKLDLVAGIAAREYLHGGLKYQYSDITQLGFTIGTKVWDDTESITTWSIDHQIHFGNIAFTSNRPVWYARQGYTLSVNKRNEMVANNPVTEVRYSYINLALGREFPVNDWLGFNADFGLIWQFRKYEEGKQSPIDTESIFMPLARIQMFISF